MEIVARKFEKRCLEHPRKIALICDDKSITFSALLKKNFRLSSDLNSVSLCNTIVGILLPNGLEFISAFFSILFSNAAVVTFDPLRSETEILNMLALYPVDGLITTYDLRTTFSNALKDYKTHNLKDQSVIILERKKRIWQAMYAKEKLQQAMFVGFTSGTTKLPKGFIQTHKAWDASFRASEIEFNTNKEDVTIAPGPLYHGLTLYAAIEALVEGRTCIITEKFDTQRLKFILEKYSSLSLVAVPTMVSKFINETADSKECFQNLNKLILSGSKLSSNLVKDIFRIFPNTTIYEYYGASELGFLGIRKLMSTSNQPSGFKPFLGTTIEVRDANGILKATNSIGTIWVKSKYISLGYVSHIDDTGFKKRGKWSSVGDQGFIDAYGFLHIIGREGEMIITGGVNVYPYEIEMVLKDCKLINEAYIVALEDPVWGQKICALIKWENERQLNQRALKDFCRANLQTYRCPKHFYTVKNFPMTQSGKVIKSLLIDGIQNNLYEEIT